MSRTLKDKVRTQVRKAKKEEEKRRKEEERLQDSEALCIVEKVMQSRLDKLEEVNRFPRVNEVYEIGTGRLKKLGFMDGFSDCYVPAYQGGKYTPVQLLARKYQAKLSKARKVRAQEVREACKQVVKKLEEGQFSIRGQFKKVIRVEVDGNCGQYKYDKMVAEEFFDRRKLSLLDVRDGYFFFNIPD